MFKKILIWFFAILGGIFFCLLVGLAYLIIADPFNLRPLITMFMATAPTSEERVSSNRAIETIVQPPAFEEKSDSSTGDTTLDTSPQTLPVTDAQAEALESVGLEAQALSQVQEACFVRILGQARVDEVKAGAVPTAAEFFNARECLP